MASIFTYDPDPPRVASPWLQALGEVAEDSQDGRTDSGTSSVANSISQLDRKVGMPRVTRLQAEPQEGPVEYKLHLLLRPRRKFRSSSTASLVSGTKHAQFLVTPAPHQAHHPADVRNATVSNQSAAQSLASLQQSRQHRLEQLTTQLLWRLQQSSPHHTSSATNMIIPSFPEALPELQAPREIAKLLHGLEESQGALYEIGVTDDGALVGLAVDEMQESLNNLRAMAACLGCTVEVLREETVGECEWFEDGVNARKDRKSRRTSRLVVVEALVKPQLHTRSPNLTGLELPLSTDTSEMTSLNTAPMAPATEQLRVTLTGPTGCGKSTLLGTLTTSTVDNGRGQSRLSMLKHRHEITSGITSSVTQELLGYRSMSSETEIEVVNYAGENIASWIDIHVTAAGNRLVLVSDSAGHPRYRRTTLRGLVGWAPHWTLLCVPANSAPETPAASANGFSTSPAALAPLPEMDLSGAQLELCLRLDLPLVIVITKLDLASRSGLRESLTRILNTLKAAGRKPAILPNRPGAVADEDLQFVQASVLEHVCTTVTPLLDDSRAIVPIVLTSAVDGTGISNLHALLRELPIPSISPLGETVAPPPVFHVEDIYHRSAEMTGVVISGLLRSGSISVGDKLIIGPFSGVDHEDSEDSDEPRRPKARIALPTSRSFPGALRGGHLNSSYLPMPTQEWREVTVSSIRNLRLPTHSLVADQAGTIGIVLDDANTRMAASAVLSRIRKGMVLTSTVPWPAATRTFSARFKREDLESLAVGNHVVVYISSVRASAKIVSARAPDSPPASPVIDHHDASSDAEHFLFDDMQSSLDDTLHTKVAGVITAHELLVTITFDSSQEYITIGDKILVMPGGGPGLYGGHERGEKGMAGLEGFVGIITDAQS